MNTTYKIDYDGSVGPEDAEAGRAWDVIMNNGNQRTPVAQRCTLSDARRIAICLGACEGVDSALLPEGLVRMHRAHISAQHDSLGKCSEIIESQRTTIDLLRRVVAEVKELLRNASCGEDSVGHMLVHTHDIEALEALEALLIESGE